MLLPSKINVVTKMPTEVAERGTLNYWVPEMVQDDVESGDFRDVVDYELLMRDWLLACPGNNALHYAGMYSVYAKPESVYLKGRVYTCSADIDHAYELGYNCVRDYCGHGPLIWGNHVASPDYLTLQDAVLTVGMIIKLDAALKEAATYCSYQRDPRQFTAAAHSLLGKYFYQKEAERSVSQWRIDSSDWMSFGFCTVSNVSWMGVEVIQPDIWKLNNDLSERMLTIFKLYPNIFTRHAPGVYTYGTRYINLEGTKECLQ